MRLYNFDQVLFDDGAGEQDPAGPEWRNGFGLPVVDDDRDTVRRQRLRPVTTTPARHQRRAVAGPGPSLRSVTGEPL